MNRVSKLRARPEVVVAALAIIAAVASTAMAGPLAGTSVLSKSEKKQTKKIAKNIVNAEATNLAVASARNADALENASEEALTVGRRGDGDDCNPSDGSFIDCAAATVSLPRAGRVLIVATGGQLTLAGADTAGDCRLEVDDATAAVPGLNSVSPGEVTDNTANSTASKNGFAYTAVTNVLGAGSHTFELSCNELNADTEVDQTSITATMIGSA